MTGARRDRAGRVSRVGKQPAGAPPVAVDLSRRLAALARRNWTPERDGLTQLRLGSGAEEITVYAPPEAADTLIGALTDAGRALDDTEAALDAARADVERLQARVEALEGEHDVLRAPAGEAARGASSASARARRGDAAGRDAAVTLEDVPTALIAPFRPDRRMLATAKENPLVALAVQATKAMQPDAKEIERARLLAMAYAASTGDLARFWSARTQRSTKKSR